MAARSLFSAAALSAWYAASYVRGEVWSVKAGAGEGRDGLDATASGSLFGGCDDASGGGLFLAEQDVQVKRIEARGQPLLDVEAGVENAIQGEEARQVSAV